jgi:hypothetical protein
MSMPVPLAAHAQADVLFLMHSVVVAAVLIPLLRRGAPDSR